MNLGLKGKRVFIQGASTGMGFAIAKAFVQEGALVAICSSHKQRIESAAAEIGAKAHFVIDLDREGGGTKFVEQGVRALGGIDVLITNTGGPKAGFFHNLSLSDWEMGFRRLWMSALESIVAALPHMKKQQGGRILLSTSTAAKEPIFGLTLSNSYRAGLLGLMKSLSQEIGPNGISVNAILPGYVKTERLAELNLDEKQVVEEIPLRRIGKPEEIADLFLFLASDRASYISGQAIACDGGRLHSV